jgi:hypothetical protein
VLCASTVISCSRGGDFLYHLARTKRQTLRRGHSLDVNNPDYGRWVEGTPPGDHQDWSREFNDTWNQFIENNPNASRDEVLDFMKELRNDPRFQ